MDSKTPSTRESRMCVCQELLYRANRPEVMLVAALIFRRAMNAQSAIPYSKWLRDFGDPLVLFALNSEPEDTSFAHVERFDSFDKHGLTEIRAIELSQRFHFTHIFAQSEHDILRAAALREWFRVP